MKRHLDKYGKWALVTGASDGIGRSFAYQLAEAHFNLVLVARREGILAELAEELSNKYGIQAKVIVKDLATTDACKEIFKETDNLDIGLVVTAAGFGTSGDFLGNQIEDELSMVQVNCITVTEIVHYYGNKFKAKGRGGFILFSSIVAFQGVPRTANYAATKAYIQSLGEGLAYEMKHHNIDVLTVAPGPVESGFRKRAQMVMKFTDKSEVVAKQALQALGQKNFIRPGFWGKFLELGLKTAPRWGRVLIMSFVMASMTKKKD